MTPLIGLRVAPGATGLAPGGAREVATGLAESRLTWGTAPGLGNGLLPD